MKRAIGNAVLATLAGTALGFLVAGTGGGALGALVGAVLGLMWLSVRESRPRMRSDVVPERLHRELLCIPRGRVADCTLVRDEKTGIWLDVERCSLQADVVRCTKRCLVLLNDSAV